MKLSKEEKKALLQAYNEKQNKTTICHPELVEVLLRE